jgi:hypothetical protein
LRNIVMADPGSAVPHIEITGTASPDFGVPLALNWHGGSQATRWIGDAGRGALLTGAQGSAAFARQGWFVLGEREALHVLRRTNPACPAAGELVLQLYHPAPTAAGFVTGFPSAGEPVTLRLPPGRYIVPASAPAGLEDRALFNELQGHGLLRLGSGGLAELAPPDLAAWRASAPLLRAAALRDWAGPPLDADARQLLDRLYRKADGDFLREQVRIFNSERRLLAWRVNALPQGAMWQVASGGAQLPVSNSMPPGAARLFRRLPQGWGAWTSVAAATTGASTLRLVLPRPASSGEVLGMMVAGHTDAVRGASVRAREDACDGRGCPSAGAVQRLVLQMEPGARTVELSVQPIDAAGLSDPRYRHLAMERGKLVWREPVQGAAAASFPVARVSLADRNGAALWEEGHPTEQARAAGLASLVGIQPGQANSVAGMLARLPAAAGAHSARLTLDLPLQLAAQAILDCVGMRRGAWNGRACSDGGAAPPGRQAGLVVLDTETGDILAAAGAGMGEVNGSNWAEVRDFDVANPAESPLRLPAFQHDGGSQRSPGSTFKIISALGLEQAAQRDRLLDAVLSGMPFAALDAAAQSRGFAFRSEATTYPADTPMAHVTNFHAEPADRYGQDGRFGLVQAMTYSVNTWFAWMSEMSDRTLLGSPTGGVPDVLSLDRMELRAQRPILDMANRLGFGQAQRLDGGLLPAGFRWRTWDALEATPAHIDPIHSRHELRQMAIGMRMQATPLQMALAAGAVGQGRVVNPRLLAQLDGTRAQAAGGPGLGVRLDRIRAGMKGASMARPALRRPGSWTRPAASCPRSGSPAGSNPAACRGSRTGSPSPSLPPARTPPGARTLRPSWPRCCAPWRRPVPRTERRALLVRCMASFC